MVIPVLRTQLQQSTRTIPLSRWLSAITNNTPNRLESWENEIVALEWFKDNAVKRHLQRFCEAMDEHSRYEPFVDLTNHLLELARKQLSDIAKEESPPTDGLTFLVNARNAIAKDKTQGHGVAASRLPDVILTCTLSDAEVKRRAAEGGSLRTWHEVYQFLEFKKSKKQHQRQLVDMLEREQTRTTAPPAAMPKVCHTSTVSASFDT